MPYEIKNNKRSKNSKSSPFLDDDFWDDESIPTDLARNHDKYIYDLDNVHGLEAQEKISKYTERNFNEAKY